ncbi:unnamed protein product, partial [Mesorhabditis spiculigera]
MIGYSPTKTDDYVAVQMPADPGYIVGFEPLAHADRVHHMLLYGCEEAYSEQQFWKGMATCGNGASHILYAWARNAPNLNLPPGVAFDIGHESSTIKTLVLQVHYAQPFEGNVLDYSGVTLHLSDETPRYLSAVMLFVAGYPIPPKMPQFQSNMSCPYEGETELHPFAFRTHTHAMGKLVSGFFKHGNEWTKIGKRNPQWPQLFEKIDHPLTIRKGDVMAATCRFDSTKMNETTPMGHMGTQEMCNFYMMFYWDAAKTNPFPYGAVCGGNQVANIFNEYPKDGYELLPARPELEHTAHQSGRPFGIIEEAKIHKIGSHQLGQISGLAFDQDKNLVVFHRGSRVWDQSTFDATNHLNDKAPIAAPVLLVTRFEGDTPILVKALGAGQFHLPHGVFVDIDGYMYTTDVGCHTVAKWKLNGDKLDLVWEFGEKFVPGSDHGHLCKPTAITRDGDRLFVSDGYCNARVVELTLDGKYKAQFGSPGQGAGQFALPHDIALSDRKTLLVADRQNGRVQELNTEGLLQTMTASSLFSNIYSTTAHEDTVFMLPGETSYNQFTKDEIEIKVYGSRLGTGLLEFAFGPKTEGFGRPHVLRVSPDGKHIFIGDISEQGATLWKFRIQHDSSTEPLSSGNAIYQQASAAAGAISRNAPISITFFLILGVIGAAYYYLKRGKPRGPRSLQSGFDRKGFKPLNQEDTQAFFDSDSDSD